MILMFFTWLYVLEDDLTDESELEITEKLLVKQNQTEAGEPQEVETSDSEGEIERFGLVNNFTELDGNLTYVLEKKTWILIYQVSLMNYSLWNRCIIFFQFAKFPCKVKSDEM